MSEHSGDRIERQVSVQLPAVDVTSFSGVAMPGHGRLYALTNGRFKKAKTTSSQLFIGHKQID